VPFEAMPHLENPDSGVLAHANSRTAPPGHPVFLGRDWFGDWRLRRIGRMLAAAPLHDAAGFARMQGDTLSLFAAEVLPALRAAPRPPGTARVAQDVLARWDGGVSAEAAAPLVFHATLGRFGDAVLARSGVPAEARRASPEFLRRILTEEAAGRAWCGPTGCGAMLSAAMAQAVADLSAVHGPDPSAWRWGAAHTARFEHAVLRFVPGLGALSRIETPTAGDGETVNRAGMRGEQGGMFPNVHGAGFRGVFDLADPAGAHVVIATGQSGHPMSPHWSDMLAPWREGRLLRLGPVDGAAAARISLVP
jgi:penicillin amidase